MAIAGAGSRNAFGLSVKEGGMATKLAGVTRRCLFRINFRSKSDEAGH